MAVLGKDIFDLYRPHTHTKIQFGDKGYWLSALRINPHRDPQLQYH